MNRTIEYRTGVVSARRSPTTDRLVYTHHYDRGCTRLAAPDETIVEEDVTAADAEHAAMECDYCHPAGWYDDSLRRAADSYEAPDLPRNERHGDGTGRRANVVPDAPTEKQIAFLVRLVREKCDPAAVTDPEAFVRGTATTKALASAAIDRLVALPPFVPETSEGPAPIPPNARTNRYAATCAKCGGPVGENAGLLLGSKGNWRVEHPAGGCVERTADTPTPGPRGFGPSVPAGHYAIASTGTNDLAFYRVDRPEDGQYAGRTFVKMIVGGHPDRNVRRDAVPGILARIVEAGVVESGRLYGQEIGRCCRCNRSLTDEESRRLGIGPECRKRA